ncbi:MAG: FecR domain-containing protein [Acidobacteria bacterium]|nr:FecR domain-containing protein [Acidobacteriota bacterium]
MPRDDERVKRYYIDWWNIRKSTVYAIVGIVIAGSAIVGLSMWASRSNWFAAHDTANVPKDAARIISFEGEVRITRAATRETLLVTKETYLAAGDTIQTLADGRAVIQMIDGSKYSMKPNSTMVVNDSSSIFGGKNVTVSLDDGQLNVKTDEQPQESKNVVEVADSQNRLLPNTDASFNADSQTNGGEIRVSRGGVETTIGDEKTTINENQYASVNGGKLSAREQLLAPPRPIAPANAAQVMDSTGSGVTVTFSWQDPEGNAAASYYLQIARSPIFASDAILVDRNAMMVREFRLAGLTPGTYYWRLKATARSGQTTNWNDAWKVLVVRGGDGLTIDASDWNVEAVGGTVYILTGRTQPGMFVRAVGRETFAGPDGAFKLQISTPASEVSVEVGDDRGNRSGFVLSLRNGQLLRRY